MKAEDSSLLHLFNERLMYGFFRPLALGSMLIVYKSFGIDPVPYQILSIIFHLVVSCLVFILAFKLTEDYSVGIFAGLLFGIHRTHTMSTFQISSAFSEQYCIIFYLCCIIAYVTYASNNNTRYYILSIISFICALLTKESFITLFPTLVIYEGSLLFQKDRSLWHAQLGKIIKRLAPFLTMFIIYGLGHYFFIQSSVPGLYRDLISTEPNAMVTRAADFTTWAIASHFIIALSTYFTLFVFPVEGGGYLSNSLSVYGLTDLIWLIKTVVRIGVLIAIPIIWITGTKTVRFLMLWIFLSIAPAALLYYTNFYRHIYLGAIGFSILSGIIAVQFYRSHNRLLPRLTVHGIVILTFIGHFLLTVSDQKLMDHRSRFYENIMTSFQARFSHVDETTPIYLIGGTVFIVKGMKVFHGNLGLIINIVQTDTPAQWPSFNKDTPHLILKITADGYLEER